MEILIKSEFCTLDYSSFYPILPALKLIYKAPCKDITRFPERVFPLL